MDSHQYLHTSLCHPYHCLKSVLYSQALRLSGICLKSAFYENRFNQLEKWLSDRDYKQKLVREQILKERAFSREIFLNNEINPPVKNRLALNLTLLRDFQIVLNEVEILLTPNKEHK